MKIDIQNLEVVASNLEHLARVAKKSHADMLAYLIEMAEQECTSEIKKRKALEKDS